MQSEEKLLHSSHDCSSNTAFKLQHYKDSSCGSPTVNCYGQQRVDTAQLQEPHGTQHRGNSSIQDDAHWRTDNA